MTTFTINQEQHTVNFSKKAQEQGIKGFHIDATRWFQRSYGNTYHTVRVIAILEDGKLGDVVAHSERMSYGYGDQYLQTACELLMEAGLIDCTNEYAFAGWQVREAMNIQHVAQDVQRKRDMI